MLGGNKVSWIITGTAGLIVVYAVIAAFLPASRNTLEHIEEKALGEPRLESTITGRRLNLPLRDETPDEIVVNTEEDSQDPFPSVNPENPLQYEPTPLQKLGLDPEGAKGRYEAQVFRPENQGRFQGPVFRPKPPGGSSLNEEDQGEEETPEEVKISVPKPTGWGKAQKPFIQTGGVLTAILRSDVVALSGETRALVEVIGGGKSLGVSLMRASLEGDRIQLEGTEIIGDQGSIRGKFAAFGPDGSEGLIGDSRRHVLGHFGIVMYRTALGVLALRVADSGNTLAGLVGANAGTQILGDLAGEQRGDRGIPRTVVIPRGFQFKLVALSQAAVHGSETYHEAAEPQFFGSRKRSEPDEGERLQALREYFQSDDQNFQQALQNPGYLLGLGDR